MSIPLITEQSAAFARGSVPPARQVADGVWSIPVPLTGSPLVSMFMYLVETPGGLVLVDAGFDAEDAWQALLAGLRAAGAAPSEVAATVLTHNHPDHIGLADRLRAEGGAAVAIHPLDCFATQRAVRGGFLDQLERTLLRAGVPDADRAPMLRSARRLAAHSESLVPDLLLTEGDAVGGTLQVLHTPGHTYGHISLRDHRRGLLFTGDLLMPTGEPQLAPASLPADDPGADLAASLDRIAGLRADLVLPGHQYPIADHARRARAVLTAHRARLAEVTGAAARAGTAWEIAALLSWPRPWPDMGTTAKRFAVVQTLGLLRALQRGGVVPASTQTGSS
ncbi:glyoxylase-like metal-dependent hydrolase (beta-lactamase superfamily II) [Actinocorallia herbida]|uniref:Glyoxylase-like metal-dependent hydrolase (Beta-lactamase superfamily II) n=1 Tax=Actinocorallia herbida TaxID=58109 RepID=A0A3N1CWX2_9ACTN|nr:MBL fold metallo-hydrolase [Actinocorallia herbida]ROO85809.1 glyoxylase-like metal-dependent hydrolase (beta-lactamase superfamily II) [Actinocorallia herbida]